MILWIKKGIQSQLKIAVRNFFPGIESNRLPTAAEVLRQRIEMVLQQRNLSVAAARIASLEAQVAALEAQIAAFPTNRAANLVVLKNLMESQYQANSKAFNTK